MAGLRLAWVLRGLSTATSPLSAAGHLSTELDSAFVFFPVKQEDTHYFWPFLGSTRALFKASHVSAELGSLAEKNGEVAARILGLHLDGVNIGEIPDPNRLFRSGKPPSGTGSVILSVCICVFLL